MGYELYREVKAWAPPSLTHREKLTAMVLADDANDRTRLTYSSVLAPEIMRQAMVPDDRSMRRIIARLKEEKVLEHAGGGHNGRTAKYRFLHLAPAGSSAAMPGESDPATAAGVGGSESPPYDGSPDGKAGEKNPPTDGVGGSFSASRGVKKTRPTPSPPTTSSSTTSAASGGQQQRPDIEAVCTHLADVLEATGSKRPTITAKWRTAARLLLDRDGITVDQAKTAINWAHEDDFWQAHILTPMKLREKYDTLRRQAVAKRRKGRSYQNPDDQNVYDADLIDNRNTQDDYEGDLI